MDMSSWVWNCGMTWFVSSWAIFRQTHGHMNLSFPLPLFSAPIGSLKMTFSIAPSYKQSNNHRS